MQRFQTRIPLAIPKVRLDHFLAEWLPSALAREVSRATIRNLIMGGSVYVNRHRCKNAFTPLFSGAIVEVYYDEVRLFKGRARRMEVSRLGTERIVFEDGWLIAVNKPSGIPTQPTLDPLRPNLYSLVKVLLSERERNPDAYVGLHHRLDRDTSGVVLFTKREVANKGVADLFSEHRIRKSYHAICWRSPGAKTYGPAGEFAVENHLGKVGERSGKKCYGAVTSGGDLAITDFRVIEAFRDAYWLEAKPKTGRTHQIRAHLSEEGLPIFGDELYFPEGVSPILPPPRLMLHAHKLEFDHPVTGEPIRIEAAFPEEFVNYLAQFK
ncbi:MAG: RluA family pseudouridine synthase [Bdellovibrionales bacterium]|nr:RluA family pseudouridine synthase [Bdellovibrionales bacterium]